MNGRVCQTLQEAIELAKTGAVNIHNLGEYAMFCEIRLHGQKIEAPVAASAVDFWVEHFVKGDDGCFLVDLATNAPLIKRSHGIVEIEFQRHN